MGIVKLYGSVDEQLGQIVERRLLGVCVDCHRCYGDRTFRCGIKSHIPKLLDLLRRCRHGDFNKHRGRLEVGILLTEAYEVIVNLLSNHSLYMAGFSGPFSMALRMAGLVSMGEPCAAHFHWCGEEVVQRKEIQLTLKVGIHGVDDGVAHFPESLDCGELFSVMFALVVTHELVIVAHDKLEVVGEYQLRIHA